MLKGVSLMQTSPAALFTVGEVEVRLLECAHVVLLLIGSFSCLGMIHDDASRHDRPPGYLTPAVQQVESLALRRSLNFEAIAINLLSRSKVLHRAAMLLSEASWSLVLGFIV